MQITALLLQQFLSHWNPSSPPRKCQWFQRTFPESRLLLDRNSQPSFSSFLHPGAQIWQGKNWQKLESRHNQTATYPSDRSQNEVVLRQFKQPPRNPNSKAGSDAGAVPGKYTTCSTVCTFLHLFHLWIWSTLVSCPTLSTARNIMISLSFCNVPTIRAMESLKPVARTASMVPCRACLWAWHVSAAELSSRQPAVEFPACRCCAPLIAPLIQWIHHDTCANGRGWQPLCSCFSRRTPQLHLDLLTPTSASGAETARESSAMVKMVSGREEPPGKCLTSI